MVATFRRYEPGAVPVGRHPPGMAGALPASPGKDNRPLLVQNQYPAIQLEVPLSGGPGKIHTVLTDLSLRHAAGNRRRPYGSKRACPARRKIEQVLGEMVQKGGIG
jgi:hypothetical protein